MKSAEFNFERDIKPLRYFAGRICHDLNNLITSSMGAISLLELKLGMMHSTHLEVEMDRINKSISNYRMFTQRLNNVFLEISPNMLSVDFNLVMSSIENDFNREISIQSLETPCKVTMDGTQVPLAIKEIIFNAIENSTEDQSIEVVLKQITDDEGSWVHFTCTDHGRGIDEEDLSQVFTPFFSTEKRGNLVGLGLPQAGHILYQHQTILKVSSEEGKGTTVSFKMKAAE